MQCAMDGEESKLIGWRMARCAIGAAVSFACLGNSAIDADDDVAEWERFTSNGRSGNLVCGLSRGARSGGVGGRLKEWEAQYICCAALLHL
jgi:hypothetical protein